MCALTQKINNNKKKGSEHQKYYKQLQKKKIQIKSISREKDKQQWGKNTKRKKLQLCTGIANINK